MGIEDTSKWCLERCISLGHCEVFEDLAKMSTSQVQDFCKACVIGEVQGADECDVQWMFAEDALGRRGHALGPQGLLAVRETARRRRISERATRRAAGSDLSGRSGRGPLENIRFLARVRQTG